MTEPPPSPYIDTVTRYRTQDGTEFVHLADAYRHIAKCNLTGIFQEALKYGELSTDDAAAAVVKNADRVREWLDTIVPKETPQ